MVEPCIEEARAVLVAQIAELSVRHQPVLALLEELLEVVRSKHLLSLLLEEKVQIAQLDVVDTLIINLRQSVQLLA